VGLDPSRHQDSRRLIRFNSSLSRLRVFLRRTGGPIKPYLLETAPLGARSAALSWQTVSTNVATVVVGLVGVGLTATMPPAGLDAYGWRIAFLVGAVTLPFALWMRRGPPETLHLAAARSCDRLGGHPLVRPLLMRISKTAGSASQSPENAMAQRG
jgi:hypothetical protein